MSLKVHHSGQPAVQQLGDVAAVNGVARARDHMRLDTPHLGQGEHVGGVALPVFTAYVKLSVLGDGLCAVLGHFIKQVGSGRNEVQMGLTLDLITSKLAHNGREKQHPTKCPVLYKACCQQHESNPIL